MLWAEEAKDAPAGAVRAAAPAAILDEVAASLCHVPRRQAGLRGVFEGVAGSASRKLALPSTGTAVVAYCAPSDGADGGVEAESMRERCANAFYRGSLASEVYARTASGLKLLKVACRICGTEQMGVRGTGCV
jgi:hypothetical protein